MADNKLLVISISNPTVWREIARFSKMHVSEYTSTLYDKKGKLLDDGIDLDANKTYWESFIDSKQAAELDRRLAMIESEDYQPGDEKFFPHAL